MSEQIFEGPIWLIGCGNMAGAMLHRWIESGLPAEQVTVVRPSGRDVAEGVRVVTELPSGSPTLLMLGFKPQQLTALAPELSRATHDATVVSILAGIATTSLRAQFPHAREIARAMPNLPVALGRGVVALHSEAGRGELITRLMQPLGLVEWIDDEGLFDAVTALAGSGPAFTYRFIDALAQGGAQLGLPPEQAARLALATVEGAGLLAAGSDLTPAQLTERVTSKGGSTRAGLDILDVNRSLDRLVEATLKAATMRNRELGLC